MLLPIRPSPMKPIRIWSSLRERLVEGRLERFEAGVEVRPEVDVDHRPAVGQQRVAIALGLGIDQLAERVRPAGDGPIDRMARGELEEDPGRRAALVELAG